MNCLVTGGAGFIGSHVVDYLLNDGHKVFVIDNLSSGNKSNLNIKAKLFEISINDKSIEDLLIKNKIEIVFHLAAQINVRKSIENPIYDAELNIIGSLNLLNACVKAKVRKIVFSSTGGAIYGEASAVPTPENYPENPESPYAIAKLSVEKYIQFFSKIHGIDYAILRYSNVYGPRQNAKGEAGVISIFVNNALNDKELSVFGSGLQTRDYVYVKDVAKANILVINKAGTYNVSTSVQTSINDLIKTISKLTNKQLKVINKDEIKGEIKVSSLDNSRIKDIGWKNDYSLEQGLNETISFFKGE